MLTDTTHYQSATASVKLVVDPPPTPIVTHDDQLADPGAYHLWHAF